MTTAEDFLNEKPSAEAFLNEAPAAAPAATPGAYDPRDVRNDFLSGTFIGRVLQSIGEAEASQYGAGPFPISDEARQAMGAKASHAVDNATAPVSKGFWDGVILPAATGLSNWWTRVHAHLGEGAPPESLTPEQQAIRSPITEPMQALDPQKIFDDREVLRATLKAKGIDPRTDGEYVELTRQLAIAQRQNVQEATALGSGVVPAAAGVTGLVERMARADARTLPEALRIAGETEAQFQGTAPRPAPEAPPIPAPEAKAVAAESSPQTLFDKTGEAAVDKAGNINLDRINAPDDVKQLIRDVATEHNDFPTATRGVISLEQTEQLAQALGMSEKDLAARNIGQAFNAEEITAARNLLVQSAARVRELAAKVPGGSDADIAAFSEATARHAVIQEQVAGLTAEAGRALSAFRIMAGEKADAEAIASLIENAGGRGRVEDLAKQIASLDTPQQVSRAVMDMRKPTWGDMIAEFFTNALLSGPQTHATYIVANTVNAILRTPETALAGVIGRIRTALGGDAERVYMGEAGAQLYGTLQGAKEGVVAAAKAIRTGAPSVLGPVERPQFKAIPGIAGEVVRAPSRVVQGIGEFYHAIGYRSELNALAYRQAASEGLSPLTSDFAARVAEITENPSEEMMAAAKANGEYQAFTQKLESQAGKLFQASVNAAPLAKIVLPFVRVPANILKYAAERTPLGLAMREVRDNLAGVNGAAMRDTQIARMTMGTGIGAATLALAGEGYISGAGPSDPKARAMLRLSGWQPYSVRIGGTWYSYNRLGPLGLIMGLAADMHDGASYMTPKESENAGASLFGSIVKNLVNESWIQGPAKLIEAVADPDRYGNKYIDGLMASFVPTGLAQVAHYEDPIVRDARTLLDTVKARIPGLSSEVMPRRDMFGSEIRREGTLGGMASAINESTLRNDPVVNKMLQLGVAPAQLERKIRGVDLTPEQYDRYQRLAGGYTRKSLEAIVPGLQGVPDWAARETVTKAISRARESGARAMLLTDPSILQQAVGAKLAQKGVTAAPPTP